MLQKLQEGFLPFSYHNAIKGRIFPKKGFCIVGNLRAACPERNIRQDLAKILHQFPHKGNVPDVAGDTYHIRMTAVDVFQDVIF